jgi:erythromycin esterase
MTDPIVTRRTLLASSAATAILGVPELTSSAMAQSPDALQNWLAAKAVAVRSVDARDEDFSDLEPLAALIGDARIVQLGEPSHAAGTCFAAKARLCKWLHQRLGFSVVVWESGFYDVELTEAGLAAGDDAVASARRGILVNWSASEEVRPPFEHARASHAGDRPLVMAGFDMSATRPFADLANELRAYVGGLRDSGLREDAMVATEETIAAFSVLNAYVEAQANLHAELIEVTGDARTEAVAAWERDVGAPLRPRRETLDRLQPAVDRLVGLFETEAAAFAAIDGERRRGFMAHNVANLGARGVNLYERHAADLPEKPEAVVQENRRDALNAENMRWLIEEGFPDRKLIVWAHNAHVMNAYYLGPDFKSVSLDPVPNAMKPMGVFLAERLGDALYTIGFTAYEGEDGWVGLQAGPIAPASVGSIEERLNQLGRPYAVLDLRGSRGAPGHPLREPKFVRVPKYDEVEIDATGPYDAIFFIARMAPATLIR